MSIPKGAPIELRKFHAGQNDIVNNLGRLSLVRAGRRFGKTTMLEDVASYLALNGKKVGWFTPTNKLLAPSFRQVKKTLLPTLDYANKTEGLIQLKTKGLIEFWTLIDEDAGRSRNYDMVIIDEAGLIKKGLKEIWQQAIRPTLLDRAGRAIMAGTPKGIDDENYFYVAATDPQQGWKEFHAPTSKNPTLPREEVANLINEYPPLVYQQEFLADFVDWRGATFFSLDAMLDGGQPVVWPGKCDTVFCTIDTGMKSGLEHDGTGIVYWAYDRYNPTIPLTILDWDYIQIDGAALEIWMPSVYQRMAELSRFCGARYSNTPAYIEDKASGTILLQQAKRHGWEAIAIDSALTAAGKDERALSVSGYVHRGMVKISRHAYDKLTAFKNITRNHFLTQILGFKIGVDQGTGTDDLLDCFTYGIAITLGNSEGY